MWKFTGVAVTQTSQGVLKPKAQICPNPFSCKPVPISEIEVIVESDDPRKALPSSLHLTTLPGQAATLDHGLLCGDQAVGLVSSPDWKVYSARANDICRPPLFVTIRARSWAIADLCSALLYLRSHFSGHTGSYLWIAATGSVNPYWVFQFNWFWIRAVKYLIVLEFPHLHNAGLHSEVTAKTIGSKSSNAESSLLL